jgi:hypothetical protein
MRHQVRAVLGTLLVVGLLLPVSAAARTSGHETMNGVIVASGKTGTRTVVSSVLVARGVFNGVGRIVEIESLPTDPPDVLRDDLVFAAGTMHLVSQGSPPTFTINPRTCIYSLRAEQTSTITGGTGRFSAASGSFAGTVNAHGLAARDPDGSCSQEQTPLIDVDILTSSGTLSF